MPPPSASTKAAQRDANLPHLMLIVLLVTCFFCAGLIKRNIQAVPVLIKQNKYYGFLVRRTFLGCRAARAALCSSAPHACSSFVWFSRFSIVVQDVLDIVKYVISHFGAERLRKAEMESKQFFEVSNATPSAAAPGRQTEAQ
jgi:hypothetical protein